MLNIHMDMNMNMNMNIHIDINIHVHKHMKTIVRIHITSSTLAAALRILTCSRTLNAAASQDSERGCKSISSEFKIQKLYK